jgi:AraC family transcriptional regulator
MRDVSVLIHALEIVERRLREPFSAGDLAAACYLSYSGLQKLFDYALGCSVSEYITKRRLTLATRELSEKGKTVTGIALDYGYGSPEAFSRAFKRFWGIPPKEFRRTRRFTGLHPKFIIEKNQGGIHMLKRKPLDVSELYDELKKLGGTYVLSADIINFIQVNEQYGYAAGDAVIAEAFARIERELGEEMLLFRIGGDEFAAVTGYAALPEAEALARAIVNKNGTAVKTGPHEIPLALRIGIGQIPTGTLSYQKALSILTESVEQTRRKNTEIALYIENT